MPLTLLHIGADALDAPVLRWARASGLSVVAVDTDPGAPGRHEADAFHVLPLEDPAACVALLTEGAGETRWVGAHTLRPACLPIVAAFEEARLALPHTRRVGPDPTLELELDVHAPLRPGLEVNAFLRDGDFVSGGVAELTTPRPGEVLSRMGSAIEPPTSAQRDALARTESEARRVGIEHGPVSARFVASATGELELVVLQPLFSPSIALALAPLVLGKSPIQAWFASLAEAGGPFDAMPPHARGPFPLQAWTEEGSRPEARTRVVPAEEIEPAPRSLLPQREGEVLTTGGLPLAPGYPAHVGDPDRDAPRWLFGALGRDGAEAQGRLDRARSRERVAGSSVRRGVV